MIRLASRILVVSLLTAAGVALATSAAGAQTPPPPPEPPVTLVSNLDLGAPTESANLNADHGQAFTTAGGHRVDGTNGYVVGYAVTSVSMNFAATNAATANHMELSIWLADGNGRPAEKLGVLATPASVSEGVWGTHVFAAPAGGIRLDLDTTYIVILDMKQGRGSSFVRNVKSDGESGQMHWTIANNKIFRQWHRDGGWANWKDSLGIEIAGRPVTEGPPWCTEEQRQMRQRGRELPPDCRGGFYHPWEVYPSSDPCDQPWQVPGSYRHDRGCLNR